MNELPLWIEELEQHGTDSAARAVAHMLFRETGFAPAMDFVFFDQKLMPLIVDQGGIPQLDNDPTTDPGWA